MNENVFQQSLKGIHETMKAAPACASRRAAVWDIGKPVRIMCTDTFVVGLWYCQPTLNIASICCHWKTTKDTVDK